jgi:hypothetical protein
VEVCAAAGYFQSKRHIPFLPAPKTLYDTSLSFPLPKLYTTHPFPSRSQNSIGAPFFISTNPIIGDTACVCLRHLFQPKVKDRVGNENNWIHVENTAAGAAPDGAAAAAAADGGLGPLLASETLRSMNLLEIPESPRESYTSEQPTQVHCHKKIIQRQCAYTHMYTNMHNTE